MHILAIDVGTSSVKAAVLDVASTVPVSAIARVPYALDHPSADAAEVPAERLWGVVVAAARQAAAETGGSIEAIGLSCLTPALVLLDVTGQPLAPVWTHLDRRARPAARQVWAAVGEEFLASAGNRPLPGGISAVCWRQQLDDNPYFKLKVKSYLHLNGWLGFRMTGERAFDPANASFSGLCNTVTDGLWSERWCGYFQVDPAWLPPVVCGSTTLGALRPGPAVELGVAAGLPVKLGTADTSSAMLAAGMVEGDLMHVVGTTQVLAAVVKTPHPSPRRLTRRFGVGDAFIHVTHNPVGGAALDWLHQLCFQDLSPNEFFAKTIPEALKRSTSTRVALNPPFLGGDRLEIEECRASFRDLTLANDRLDLLAALLEALRRRHCEALADLGLEHPVKRVFLTGGGAEVVRRLLPDYAQAPVHLLEEGSLRGVARLFG